MLVIRDAQFVELARQNVRVFEERLIAHLREFFPAQTHDRHDAALRAIVAFGIVRARRHGLEAESDLCKYLNLMFVFGAEFDVDTRFSWARRSLDNTAIGPTLKINRLYFDALDHEQEGLGLTSATDRGGS